MTANFLMYSPRNRIIRIGSLIIGPYALISSVLQRIVCSNALLIVKLSTTCQCEYRSFQWQTRSSNSGCHAIIICVRGQRQVNRVPVLLDLPLLVSLMQKKSLPCTYRQISVGPAYNLLNGYLKILTRYECVICLFILSLSKLRWLIQVYGAANILK